MGSLIVWSKAEGLLLKESRKSAVFSNLLTQLASQMPCRVNSVWPSMSFVRCGYKSMDMEPYIHQRSAYSFELSEYFFFLLTRCFCSVMCVCVYMHVCVLLPPYLTWDLYFTRVLESSLNPRVCQTSSAS